MSAAASVALLLALLLGHGGQAFAGQGASVLEQDHRDWKSQITYGGDDVLFRAFSAYAESSEYVLLAFDRYPSDCSLQRVSMVVRMSRPNRREFVSDDLVGALRVDERPIRNILYDFVMREGESVMFIRLRDWDRETTFLSELQKGAMLRFKLPTDRKDYYARFSLQGFSAASDRTLRLCQEFKRAEDERYFEQTPERDDADFFRGDGSSRGRERTL